MDFTVKIYKELLKALQEKEYVFQTFEEFIRNPAEKSIVLRHDVDLLPYNSLRFAEIQAENYIKGVYYFRAVPESWDEEVILKIKELGHEIGYHYECITTCKGNMEASIKDFNENLQALRKLAPVSTICMHGSPASKYDSKDLWIDHSYRDFGIIAEPYFDVDFKKVFYLTDTGRRWDGHKVSVRDRVESGFDLSFHSTKNIIAYLKTNELPNQIMFTFHPQRWNDNVYRWTKELILQNIKNVVKKVLYVK
ncbi:hypothetical protein MWU59_06890 [Flavobacteriaceae bacterium F08102]|nr:hypothetical protein [Flavobacteriaceae bacterium F08102]